MFQIVQNDPWFLLFAGIFLGSFAMMSLYRVILAAIICGLLARDYLRSSPRSFPYPALPHRDWVFALLVFIVLGSIGFGVYRWRFWPRPNIIVTKANFSFVPRIGGSFLEAVDDSFLNDSDTKSRGVTEAKYIWRRPEECASHVLTESEIQAIANDLHHDFLTQRVNESDFITVQDVVSAHEAFSPSERNTGQALSLNEVQEFLEGKCVIFFARRIRYSRNQYTDYFRYVFRRPNITIPVTRYESRGTL